MGQAQRRRWGWRERLAAAGVVGLAIALLAVPLALAFDLPPSETGREVYDFAKIWRADTVSSAEQTAQRLRTQAGVQIAVVSIPSGESSVDTAEAEQTAKDIMDAWGVGGAKNNGIVVLFDLDTTLRHGQIYIYSGSGALATYVSKAAAQNIANDMLAKAKEGDLNAALAVGMDQIAGAVDRPGSRLESVPLLTWQAIVALVLNGLVVLWVIRSWWRDGRDAPVPLIDDSVLLPAPPPGMTPSMAALLRDGVATKNAMAASLVDLSSRNLMAMREGSTHFGIGRKPIEYIVSDPSDPRVANAETLVGDPELIVLHAFRRVAKGGVVTQTEMRGLTTLQSSFATSLGRAAAKTPWYKRDPNAAVSSIGWLVLIPMLLLFALLIPFADSMPVVSILVVVASSVGAMIIALMISRLMAARTTEGSWAVGMALAYRNTMRHEMGTAPGVVSAQQRAQLKMPWLETPDALIVWAVALGLADEVGNLLKRSTDDPASANWHPAWYAGSAASFSSFGSSISSINVTAASSSGGGYGGGSSGGGGGGGGGF
jgi:uncharacterized membrane protein YgcG